MTGGLGTVTRASTGAATPSIQLCRAGSEEALANFFRSTTHEPSSSEYWRWKYFENPAGPACVAVALVGRDIVGSLAFLPFRTRVHAREVVSAQQVDVAIKPEYRRGGVYFRLAQALITEAVERGIAFGFGFATDETLALSVQFLGFTPVGTVRRLVKVLNYWHYAGAMFGPRVARALRRIGTPNRGRDRRAAGRRALGVEPIDRFDERFDSLAANVTQGRIMLVRDAAYLNWRYVDCPTVAYARYAARTGDDVRGFVVFHAFKDKGVVRGIIDELVCSSEDSDLVEGLLSTAVSDLAAEGAVNAVCWLPSWHPLAARLRAVGFRERKARNHLIVLPNESKMLDDEQLGEESSWYYTHGDSDYHMTSG